MGKIFAEITAEVAEFIRAQHIFFVATAPLSPTGHVNLSPKGLDSLRIIAPTQVAYIDYNGSGVETIAHIRENARLTIMFCAFAGPPKILRLYGRGRVLEPHDAAADAILPQFATAAAFRAIIILDVTRIADSCGFGVPLMSFQADRDQLAHWAERKGPAAIAEYQRSKNAHSLDGLPGLPSTSALS